MAKIVYGQMPAPRQKLGCKSPSAEINFLCKSPGVRGGMVMDEIDTCISFPKNDGGHTRFTDNDTSEK